jgi:RND family efflux transporter MFP subunit
MGAGPRRAWRQQALGAALALAAPWAVAQGAIAVPAVAVPATAPSAAATALGYTQALSEVKLSLTVTGKIDRVPVREGERVRRGQVLLQLDSRSEGLEVERRTLILRDVARLEELRQREAKLNEQLASARKLFDDGGMARKQVEDEELALSNVKAERRALEASKQRERVELNLAQEAFDKRFLRSPANGVVTKIHFREGESVGAHEPAVVVSDTSRVRFLGNVPAAEASRVAPGAKVTLRLGPEGREVARTAQVVFLSPVADPASGLVAVTAEFDNADGSIRPGVTGRLVLPGAAAPARAR